MTKSSSHADALIAYVTWDRLVPWKILSLPKRRNGAFFPIGYGSDQKALRKHGGKGTKLWVVTLPWVKNKKTGKVRAYPFVSLVARMESAGVYKSWREVPRELRSDGLRGLLGDWDWVVAALPDPEKSYFCELNNVNEALKNLGTIKLADLRGRSTARKKIGSRLQAIRTPCANADEVETEFQACLSTDQQRTPTVLISFKSEDNYQYALDLAEALLKKGYSCWLDSLTIPLYKLVKNDPKAQKRLEKLIDVGIRHSDLAVALVSENYATGTDRPNWTKYERDSIRHEKKQQRPKFRALALLDGVEKDTATKEAFHHCMTKGKVLPTAKSIVAWYRAECGR